MTDTRHDDRLRAVLYLNGLRGDELEEALQEVHARTLAKPPRDPGALGRWQAVVAINVALDRHRRAKREAATLERLYAVSSIEAPDASADVLLRETVARGLAELDAEMRAVVILRFFEDLALADIARELDLPLGTVKSRLHRGIAQLRAALPRQEVLR